MFHLAENIFYFIKIRTSPSKTNRKFMRANRMKTLAFGNIKINFNIPLTFRIFAD